MPGYAGKMMGQVFMYVQHAEIFHKCQYRSIMKDEYIDLGASAI